MTDSVEPRWSDPGSYEVAPGVFRMPLPMPGDGLTAINVYALAAPDGRVTLVDGGWAIGEAYDALGAALSAAGLAMGDITDVLVTHAHRDHYTLAVGVRRELGSRVSLGAAERINLESLAVRHPGDDVWLAAVLRRAGAPEHASMICRAQVTHDRSDWELPDRWLDNGYVVETAGRALRVVHTPGHTRGHVVYLDEAAGLMFSGDHVLSRITPSIGFEEVPPPSPLADFLASLRMLRDLPDVRLLPGHGPTAPSVHARVGELLDHHEERLLAAADVIAAGAATARDVAVRLTWTRRHRRFDELDEFNQMLATSETYAHLVVLAERGVLDRTTTPGGADTFEQVARMVRGAVGVRELG